MLKRDDWLDNGLHLSRSEYARFKRLKVVKATLISLVVCSSILGAIEAQESLSVMSVRSHLFSSYEQVVLDAMNGDARFSVGNELFECKGGYLGPT
jgi:hypothetical protein